MYFCFICMLLICFSMTVAIFEILSIPLGFGSNLWSCSYSINKWIQIVLFLQFLKLPFYLIYCFYGFCLLSFLLLSPHCPQEKAEEDLMLCFLSDGGHSLVSLESGHFPKALGWEREERKRTSGRKRTSPFSSYSVWFPCWFKNLAFCPISLQVRKRGGC